VTEKRGDGGGGQSGTDKQIQITGDNIGRVKRNKTEEKEMGTKGRVTN